MVYYEKDGMYPLGTLLMILLSLLAYLLLYVLMYTIIPFAPAHNGINL